MHTYAKYLPNKSYCIGLVVTKAILNIEQNPFMDERDIDCVHIGPRHLILGQKHAGRDTFHDD